MSKVFLIGLDCANPNLIREWKSLLPNLGKMIEGGVFGKLESTIPPATCPAWNCLATGKNPAKIGIFHLLALPFTEQGGFQIVNFSYQDGRSVWDILGDNDMHVGIINVPTTYPPQPVNGFMVSGGLLTPLYRDADYTFPPELKSELDKAVGGYEVAPLIDTSVPNKEGEYLEKLKRNMDKQVEAVKYLITNYPWDFLMYVCCETDCVQHYFWHHMDATHPKHDVNKGQQYGHAIQEIYQRADRAVGELMAAAGDDTTFVVVSDHGSGPLYGYFLVNEWLRKIGFLTLQDQKQSWQEIIMRRLLVPLKRFLITYCSPELVNLLLKITPRRLLERFLIREGVKREGIRLMQAIDWSTTKAYGLVGDGSIFVNLKGREDHGIVEPGDYEDIRAQITEKLYELRDPAGRKVVDRVFKREEIYEGKYLDVAPDLLFTLDGFRYVQRADIGGGAVWTEPVTSGGHSMDGTFIAYGPDIAKGVEIQNARIYDVAPTILHLFQLPVPTDMDGRVLLEIFDKKSSYAKSPVAYQDSEREQLSQRIRELRKLGKI